MSGFTGRLVPIFVVSLMLWQTGRAQELQSVKIVAVGNNPAVDFQEPKKDAVDTKTPKVDPKAKTDEPKKDKKEDAKDKKEASVIPDIPVVASTDASQYLSNRARYTPTMLGDLNSRYTTATTPVRVLLKGTAFNESVLGGTGFITLPGTQENKKVPITLAQKPVRYTVDLTADYYEHLRIPYVAAGAFKISENESPRPLDRIYVDYNYFSSVSRDVVNIPGQITAAQLTNFGIPTAVGPQTPIEIAEFAKIANYFKQAKGINAAAYNAYIQGVLVSGDALHPKISDPALGSLINATIAAIKAANPTIKYGRPFPNSIPIYQTGSITVSGGPFGSNQPITIAPTNLSQHADINRETLGFEKTFLDGDASFGMRLPIIQVAGIDGSSELGDITAIFKYAFINNLETGNLLSGGLAVTAPTGRSASTIDGSIHSTLIQPYMGVIYNLSEKWFVHGFTGILVPTDSRDVTFLSNDYGLGYRLYQAEDASSTISSIIPTLELHVTSPLNHRDQFEPAFIPDTVSLTGGITFGIGARTSLAIAANTPLTGPKPYEYELMVQLNYNFGSLPPTTNYTPISR